MSFADKGNEAVSVRKNIAMNGSPVLDDDFSILDVRFT
jgi:hypothetical protein